MIPISGISNKAGRPAEREAEMSTRKTTAGWVIETTNRVYGMLEQGGVCGREVLYTRDQIERAGFRYEDDPDGIADGEFSRRAEMLEHNEQPAKVLRRGTKIQ